MIDKIKNSKKPLVLEVQKLVFRYKKEYSYFWQDL